mgnify:CR=1 FL=1
MEKLNKWIAEANYLSNICTSKGIEIDNLRRNGDSLGAIELSIAVNALIVERVEYLVELESQMSVEKRSVVYEYIDKTLKPIWDKAGIKTFRLLYSIKGVNSND